MNHKSVIEINTNNAKKIHDALKPEMEKEVTKRSKITIKKLKTKLIITVVSQDINALRAGINNTLRLVHAAETTMKIK